MTSESNLGYSVPDSIINALKNADKVSEDLDIQEYIYSKLDKVPDQDLENFYISFSAFVEGFVTGLEESDDIFSQDIKVTLYDLKEFTEEYGFVLSYIKDKKGELLNSDNRLANLLCDEYHAMCFNEAIEQMGDIVIKIKELEDQIDDLDKNNKKLPSLQTNLEKKIRIFKTINIGYKTQLVDIQRNPDYFRVSLRNQSYSAREN